MKKKFIRILIILTVAFSTLLTFAQKTAAETHTQNLTIVKYGLSTGATGFSPDQSIDTGLQINGIPIDNLGNELSPLAGVHYLIQEVDPASQQTIEPATELITNSAGVASVTLPDGLYKVSEQANSQLGLTRPALPLLINLPMAGLSTVYIYPKSSVDQPTEKAQNPPPSPPTSSSSSSSITKTSSSQAKSAAVASPKTSKAPAKSFPVMIQQMINNTILPLAGEQDSWLLFGLGLALLLFFSIYLIREKRSSSKQ